jgi:hypothetical protein
MPLKKVAKPGVLPLAKPQPDPLLRFGQALGEALPRGGRSPFGQFSMRAVSLAALVAGVAGHGQMNYPPSTRQGYPGKTWPGALAGQGAGGFCEQPNSMSGNPGTGGVPKPGGNPLNGACMLFSQPNAKQPKISIIPGEPTLNEAKYRTNNVNVSSGDGDWTRTMPWRDPGMSPVLGSGCGVAGGGIMWNSNGGWPATGMQQGEDPLSVLKPPAAGPQTMWQAGSTQTVAMGVWANHGGGCKCAHPPQRAVPQLL